MATGAAALLSPAPQSAIAGSARRLVALAGALSPGADVGVLSRAMEELERLAGEMSMELPSCLLQMAADAGAAAALLHPTALSDVAGSARHLVALAGALNLGADVGVLTRAREELERLAGGTDTDRVEPSASASTDMEIGSGAPNQLPGGSPGTKRRREAPGVFQRSAKRRILAS